MLSLNYLLYLSIRISFVQQMRDMKMSLKSMHVCNRQYKVRRQRYPKITRCVTKTGPHPPSSAEV